MNNTIPGQKSPNPSQAPNPTPKGEVPPPTAKKDTQDKIGGIPKKVVFIGGPILFLVLLSLVGLALFATSGDGAKKQQTQQVQQGQDGQPVESNQLQAMTVVTPDFVSANGFYQTLPVDHWLRQPNPINLFSEKKVIEALQGTSYWDATNNSLNINGRNFALNDPFIMQGINTIVTNMQPRLAEVMKTEVNSGSHFVLIKNDEEAVKSGKPEYETLTNAETVNKVETFITAIAKENVLQGIGQLVSQVPVQPQVQAAPVDNGISEKQRKQFNDLIRAQEREIEDLRAEVLRMKKDALEKDRQMINLLQRIEDSPKANFNLKARMMAEDLGYKLSAIQGDLIFLKTPQGETRAFRLGDHIGSGHYISGANAATGVVYVSGVK